MANLNLEKYFMSIRSAECLLDQAGREAPAKEYLYGILWNMSNIKMVCSQYSLGHDEWFFDMNALIPAITRVGDDGTAEDLFRELGTRLISIGDVFDQCIIKEVQ